MADINVTPLCDVMIVLLIIFMVATPLLDETPGLELPPSRTARDLDPAKDVVVVIRGDGMTELDGELFVSSVQLLLRLQARLEPRDGGPRIVRVKADRGLRYGQVQAVLQACREAGADRIALMAAREPFL
jgi:biopolymer transport protein ExbD